MAKQVFSNFASCKLGAAIVTTSAIASLSLEAGQGSRFPSPSGGDWFVLCLLKADNSAIELFKITSRSGDVLTVDTRAFDGSTAATWSTADIAKCVVNSGAMADLNAAIAALQADMTAAESDIADLVSDLATANATLAQRPRMDVGTKVPFFQAVAPTGWTQDTSVNDKVLRVVDSTGAGSGGSWTISGISVDGHALTSSEMPSHTHGLRGFGSFQSGGSKFGIEGGGPPDDTATNSTGSGSAHTHGLTIGSSWRPAYIDVIVCTRQSG